MSFGGDLHTFDVLDLVGWLMGRAGGRPADDAPLHEEAHGVPRRAAPVVELERPARETIGQVLVRDGPISEEALFRALLRQESGQDKRRLGEILIAEDLLSEPQLLQTLRGNAEAQLYDCSPVGRRPLRFRRRQAARARAFRPRDRHEADPEEAATAARNGNKLRTRFTSNEVTLQADGGPRPE